MCLVKGYYTIATNLWLHLKFRIQTTLKTFQNSKVWCIVGNYLVSLKTYFPKLLVYIYLSQFIACSQQHHQGMPLSCAP
jgi:hypothetical protein